MSSKKFLFSAATAILAMAATAAEAQTTVTNPSTAVNSSAYNQVYVGYGSGDSGSGGGSGGGTGAENINYHDSGPGGIPAGTAGMSAPYIVNSNPCAIGNGMSAVGGPFALSGSFSHVDAACSSRANAGGLVGMKQGGMALVNLCNAQKKLADAFWYTYYMVCPGTKVRDYYKTPDGSKPVVAVVNPVTGEILNIEQSPVLGQYIRWKREQAQKAQMQLIAARRARPEWCDHVSAKEKAKHGDMCK